ncbi:MAG: hypothetical protein ACREJO_18690 [Phycisphaerales bacterium]
MAAGLCDNSVIPAGLYRTTGADSATATGFDAAFAGMNGQGTWSLMISDNAGQDLGRLASRRISPLRMPPRRPEPRLCWVWVGWWWWAAAAGESCTTDLTHQGPGVLPGAFSLAS